MGAEELADCVEAAVAFGFDDDFDVVGVDGFDREFSDEGGAVVAAVQADWAAGGEAERVREIVRDVVGAAGF